MTRRPETLRAAIVAGLIVMATWTLVVKYVVPLAWVVSERAAGRPAGPPPIMWDFWWVAHLALAWMIWRRHKEARRAGLVVAGVEIVIVAVKFAIYVNAPDLSLFGLLWFTNKVYVLAFFIFLFGALRTDAFRERETAA